MDAAYLRKSVLSTVAYYDVFGLPLTAFEVWKYLTPHDPERPLLGPIGYLAILEALQSEGTRRVIGARDGMYFLKGRERLVSERIAAEKVSVGKLKRMSRLARFLAAVPFVRMIAVSGSLALKRSDTGSDWDLFVVLAAGRIWSGRTLLTALLHALGKRRHGRQVRDRACLNYFVTDGALPVRTRDLFAAHEYRRLYPLFGRVIFERFERKNGWIMGYQVNFTLTALSNRLFAPESRVALVVRGFGERLWNSLDRLLALERRLSVRQRRKIGENPKTALPGSLIVADDEALIFLPKPRGPRVFSEYKARLAEASGRM
jgi:hypothetical protein